MSLHSLIPSSAAGRLLVSCALLGLFSTSILAQEQEDSKPTAASESKTKAAARLMQMKPIPQAPGAFLEKDYKAQECEWAHRCLLVPAKAHWQGQSWAKEAEDLTSQAIDCLIWYTSPSRKTLNDLAPALKELQARTEDDSLITFLTAKAIWQAEGRRASLPFTKKLLERNNLSGVLEMWVIEQRYDELQVDEGDRAALDQRMSEALIRALNDNSYDAKADAVLVRHQLDRIGTPKGLNRQADLERWQVELQRSHWPEWVKLTLLGRSEVALAWIERTSKWAKDVTPRQWQAFRDRLNVAFETLRRSHHLRPDRPEAAGVMITVMMGLNRGREQEGEWFEKAVTAQFDYYPAYHNLLTCLLPRWGGSYEQMLAFGVACAETKRFDTEVPRRLVITARLVCDELHVHQPIFRDPDVKAAVATMARGYLEQKGRTPNDQKFRLSEAAACAWLTGDDTLAQEILEKVGPRLHWATADWLHSLNEHEAGMRARIAEGTGGFGEPLREVLNSAPSTTPQEMLSRLKSIDEKSLKPEAQEYVSEIREVLAFPKAFAIGEWVPVKPRQHLCAFYHTGGGWSVDSDGALVASGTDEASTLFWRVPVGGDVEVRGEFQLELPEKVSWAGQGCGVGVIMNWAPSTGAGMRYMFYQASWGVTTARAFYKEFTQGPPVRFVTFKPTNSFHVRMSKGQITYDFNGEPMCSVWKVPAKAATKFDGCVGFTVDRLPQGARVKFTNLSMRKCDATRLEEVASAVPVSQGSKSKPVVHKTAPEASAALASAADGLQKLATRMSPYASYMTCAGWAFLGLGVLTMLGGVGLGFAERSRRPDTRA